LHRVSVAVGVFALHVVLQSQSLRRIGVAVAVIMLCMVLRVLSLCHGHCAAWVLQSVFLRRVWYCGRRCAACGVAGAITAPRVVSWVLSLCHGDVTVMVVVPHVVLQLLSSCHTWCRGCCYCAVVVLRSRSLCVWVLWLMLCYMWCCHTACGITVMVVVLCVVSWSRSLHHVSVAVAVFVLRVVLRSQSLCHMWHHGRHHYVWFHSRGGWPWKERTDACLLAREVVRA